MPEHLRLYLQLFMKLPLKPFLPLLLRPLLRLTLPLLLCCTFSAAAEDESWYRVELLIFSQGDERPGEFFQPTPTLNYPDAFRFLGYPQQLALHQRQSQALAQPQFQSTELESQQTVELDEVGRTMIKNGLLPLEVPNAETPETDWPMTQTPQLAEPLIDAEPAPSNLEGEEPPAPRPTPFTALS